MRSSGEERTQCKGWVVSMNAERRREASMLKKQRLRGLVGDGEGDTRLLGFWQGQLPATFRDLLSQMVLVALPHLS